MKRVYFVLFLATLAVVFLFSCGKERFEKAQHTIKGYAYYGEDTIPRENEEYAFYLYKKAGFNLKGRSETWLGRLGTATTDANGYIEFTYESQSEGDFIQMELVKPSTPRERYRLPLNKNVEQNFYTSVFGEVVFFVNTNGKLEEGDTFFVAHRDFYREPSLGFPDDYVIDTIIGNFDGHLKTIRLPILYRPPYFFGGKGQTGLLHIRYNNGTYYNGEVQSTIQVKGDPHIDSVFLHY